MPHYGKLNQDGGEYEGEYERRMFGLKSVRHGVGRQTWPDGRVYAGMWENGKRHGQGKLTAPDGSLFEGEFNEGRVHGRGHSRWPDGSWYTGDYYRGFRQGKGKYYSSSECYLYDGDFLRDRLQGRGAIQFLDGRHFAGRFHEGLPIQGVYVDQEGVSYDVRFDERTPSEFSRGLFHWIREGSGFKFKTKSQVQMDATKRAELLKEAREAASEGQPKSRNSQQLRKPTLIDTLAEDEDEFDSEDDDEDEEAYFKKYSDWDRFKKQMADCGLSMKDLEKLFLNSMEDVSGGGGTPSGSILRRSASLGSDRRQRAAAAAPRESDWDRFRRGMGDTGLSLAELAELYSQSKLSASKEGADDIDVTEVSDPDDDDGPSSTASYGRGGRPRAPEDEWERFRREMSDTGLSDANLSALFHKSKQAAAAGPAAARAAAAEEEERASGHNFTSDYDRFVWEMRGLGLSKAALSSLYRESVQGAPPGGAAAAGQADGGGGGTEGRPETDWERFRREMGDTGLTLTEMARLFRKSKDAAQRRPEPRAGTEGFKRGGSFDSRRAGAGAEEPAAGGERGHGRGRRDDDDDGAAGRPPGAEKRHEADGHERPAADAKPGRRSGRASAGRTRPPTAGGADGGGAAAAGAADGGVRSEAMERRMALMNKMMKATSEALDKLGPKLAELAAAAAVSPEALLRHVYERHPPKRDAEAPPTDWGEAAMRKNILRAIRAYHEDKNPMEQHGLEWHLLCREITKQFNAKLELFR